MELRTTGTRERSYGQGIFSGKDLNSSMSFCIFDKSPSEDPILRNGVCRTKTLGRTFFVRFTSPYVGPTNKCYKSSIPTSV